MTDVENINKLIIAKLLIANWVEVYKDPELCPAYDTLLEILSTKINYCLTKRQVW